MLTERTCELGGVVLNAADGEACGTPLLLLPGATLSWDSFGPFIPKLEARHHLFAVDYRGHSTSGRTPSALRFTDYLRDLLALLDQIGDSPVVPIGLSLGASLALALAASVPHQVRAAIAIEPGFRDAVESCPEAHSWLRWLSDTLRPGSTFDDIVARCRLRDPELDDAVAQEMARSVGRVDPARGSSVRDSDAVSIATHVRGSRVVQVPGAGHLLIRGGPGRTALRHVLSFLGTLQ